MDELKKQQLKKLIREVELEDNPDKVIFEEIQSTNNELQKLNDSIGGINFHDIYTHIKGEDGKDGYTPIKGIDYIDGKDGENGENGSDGKDGTDGVDGEDGTDGEDGKDGQDGKDGSPDSPNEIALKLNSLEEVLEAKVIKGLPTLKGIVDSIKKGQLLELRDIKGATLSKQYLHGGGAKISISGTYVQSKYSNLNLIPGTGVTITSVENNATSNVDITISATATGGVTSVSNSDGTLTISPTTGVVIASLNLAHANIWTGQQTFNTFSPIVGTATTNTLTYFSASKALTSVFLGSGLTFSSGILSATGTSPAGVTGSVQFNNSGVFGGNTDIFWNNTLKVFGVQTAGNPQASGHFKSAVAITLSQPSISGSVNNATVSSPSGDNVSITAPAVGSVFNQVATPSYFSGSYFANGSNYRYQIYAYKTISGVKTFSAIAPIASFTDDNSFSNFSVNVSWNAQSGGPVDGYVVGLSINFFTFTYADIGNTTSFNDNGSGSPSWGGFTDPLTPTSDDFIANGTTYSYEYYSAGTSPSGHTYYSSAGDNQSVMDNNDGLPFRIRHINNSQNVKIHETSPNSSFYKNTLAFIEYIQYPGSSSDSSTVTPTGYGYLADGLMTEYQYRVTAYRTFGGSNVYSTPSSPLIINASPSNDWYVSASTSTVATATGYIYEKSNNGGVSWFEYFTVLASGSTTLSDDALLTWSAGAATITPTTLTPAAGLFEKDQASISDVPVLIVRSLNVSTPSPYIQFQDSTGTNLADIGRDTSINGLYLNDNARIRLEASISYVQIDSSIQLGGNTEVTGTFLVDSTSKFNRSIRYAYRAITTTYTLDVTDYVVNATSGTFTTTLPTAVGVSGTIYYIKNSGTGVVTVATTSSQTIDGSLTFVLGTQGQTICVQSTGANWIILSSNP